MQRGYVVAVLCLVAGGMGLIAPSLASAQIITEFPLPPGPSVNSPVLDYGRAIVSGPDGNLWLSHGARSSVIRMTPAGQVAEFHLDGGAGGVAVGADGSIWVTGTGVTTGQVTRLGLDGVVTGRFPVQAGSLYLAGIVGGPDGSLWFTAANPYAGMPGGLMGVGGVGRITVAGSVSEYRLPVNAGATGIIAGPDGTMWFIWDGALGRATLQGTLSRIQMQPSAVGPLAALTLGPSGNVWFTVPAVLSGTILDDTVGYIGLITPAGVVSQYAVPTAHAYPFDITAGPDGNLWFTEQSGNKIGRVTPAGVITEFSVPTDGAGPTAICVGPDGNIWFTEANAAKVGRLVLSGPASGNTTVTVPAAASSAGANGSYFHSDLWLLNRSFSSPAVATLTYRCAVALSCPGNVQSVSLAPRQSAMLTDVIRTTFGAPGTNGAIEVSWPTSTGPITVSSRVSSPLPPAPAFGTMIPALTATDARTRAVFVAVASGGGLGSGSRSNTGAYNPQSVSVDLVFTLYSGDGTVLGAYSRTYLPTEAYQLPENIFDLLGVGATTTANAYLVVTASAPVYAYVTVIDNVSGDGSFLPASDDEAK